MTYEKEIPAYALQVAKVPQITPCQAVYHTETLMSTGARQCITYQFEEDILVPDTKEDMEEILLMDGRCDLMPTERKLSPKTDDLLNFTGTITLQTLYRPENPDCLPVSITSKVPYQYQWHLHLEAPAEGVFQCKVKSLEHMIVNERKFRVKVTLEFTGQLYLKQELSLFQGLEQEPLEMKKEQISLCCLETMKQEEVQIDGWMEVSDAKVVPKTLLQQYYTITENYRQVTSEKIVLNGFLLADFIYCGEDEDGEERLCHQRGRMEFTQFLPLEKKHRGKKWSLVKTSFRDQGLTATLQKNENGVEAFHVEGRIETCITLYGAREQEMVVDAYHQTKSFTCNFTKEKRKDLLCSTGTELSFRELMQLPEGSKAEFAVCGRCRPVTWECMPEKGRARVDLALEFLCLWKGEAGYRVTRMTCQLQQVVEIDEMDSSMEISASFFAKECRVTLVSDRQIEIAGSLWMSCDGTKEKTIQLLDGPGFMEGDMQKQPAMIITAVDQDEDLWSLAKRYRTTEEQIRRVNHLDSDAISGRKIFIIR